MSVRGQIVRVARRGIRNEALIHDAMVRPIPLRRALPLTTGVRPLGVAGRDVSPRNATARGQTPGRGRSERVAWSYAAGVGSATGAVRL
jgi:hypothetical protein